MQPFILHYGNNIIVSQISEFEVLDLAKTGKILCEKYQLNLKQIQTTTAFKL